MPDLDNDQHHRLLDSLKVVSRDQLSINLLELLGMVLNAAVGRPSATVS